MTTDHLTHETAVSSPALAPAPTRERRRRHAPRILRHGLFITLVIVALYPVLWMVVSSLRPDGSIFTDSGIFLDTFAAENYTEGWSALTHPFSTYLLNSAIVVLGSVIGNLIACSMTAYAFARLSFRFKKSAFAIMLLTIMLPIHVLIIPQYVLFAQLGWINTFLPLIVPKFLATDGFFIFLMVQFIRGLPRELDEAARIDGAGHPRIFLQIILPLMTPALATTAIFTFIWTWGDFFSQLVFLTDPGKYTVPVALRSFIDAQANSSYGSLFAMSVLSIIPVLVAFTFGQRYLIRGIATTGGK
ncbi:carbohydrate ABC transporter permease [Streptomyces atroolivaceus]|uniref:Carbohydrate ABC transporter permease n=1 Tax=Streptomyces atroolivaceus TaxID=66869 RepID=A0ABV9VJE4_STRAZ|nr:carbohydrate ABC transporter permease [Streptomyces atroolivaceus]